MLVSDPINTVVAFVVFVRDQAQRAGAHSAGHPMGSSTAVEGDRGLSANTTGQAEGERTESSEGWGAGWPAAASHEHATQPAGGSPNFYS